MSDQITHHDVIEAYCNRLSYGHGETVELCVSTTSPTYAVTVERWGAERETVWSQDGLTGIRHATPPDADANGCGWPVSVEIPVDPAWRSGFYLVTLEADQGPDGRRVGHACFVLRSADPSGTLFVIATNTWNAYNDWGGKSLYTGGHQVSFRRPFGRGMLTRPQVDRDDRKSRPRRYGEEPDIDGDHYQAYRFEHGFPGYMGSAGWHTYARRFVEWAEADGFAFDYAVSTDLETVDGLLDGVRAVVSAGHDEYWSAAQRDVLERFVEAGGRFASFSGNTMFWQVRLTEDTHHMVCHKYTALETDPVADVDSKAVTGMWCDVSIGRPESRFLGAGSMYGLYARFGHATARGVGGFVVYRDDHWMVEGSGLRYGDVVGADDGVVGYETVGTRITFDDVNLPVIVSDPNLPDPASVEVVGFVPASNLAVGEYPASIAALDDQGDLEFIAERAFGGGPDARARARHGNAVMLTCHPFGPEGGEVITVGSTDWVFGLGDDAVATVTANVLRRLAAAS